MGFCKDPMLPDVELVTLDCFYDRMAAGLVFRFNCLYDRMVSRLVFISDIFCTVMF